MQSQNQANTLRESIQKKLYQIMIISIAISVVIFAIKKEGFFFGIH